MNSLDVRDEIECHLRKIKAHDAGMTLAKRAMQVTSAMIIISLLLNQIALALYSCTLFLLFLLFAMNELNSPAYKQALRLFDFMDRMNVRAGRVPGG